MDREVSHVQQAAAELEKMISENSENIPAKDAIKLLGGMVSIYKYVFMKSLLNLSVLMKQAEKIQVLKRKAGESISEELQSGEVCKRRLEHLKEHGSVHTSKPVSQGSLNQWKRKRLDRMLVEYFLRNGYYNSAIQLAKKSDLEDLTNIGILNKFLFYIICTYKYLIFRCIFNISRS